MSRACTGAHGKQLQERPFLYPQRKKKNQPEASAARSEKPVRVYFEPYIATHSAAALP